jgi:hypothetical protein
MLFEAEGEKVVQLAQVDSFPTEILADELAFTDRKAYLEKRMHVLAQMFKRDSLPMRQKLADEMLDAFYGRPSSEMATKLAEMLPKISLLIFDFIDRMRESENEKRMVALRRWIGTIKAPVTVYIAEEGIQVGLPQTKDWENLGVRKVSQGARLIQVEGNHFNIVENEEVVGDLQSCYLKYI